MHLQLHLMEIEIYHHHHPQKLVKFYRYLINFIVYPTIYHETNHDHAHFCSHSNHVQIIKFIGTLICRDLLVWIMSGVRMLGYHLKSYLIIIPECCLCYFSHGFDVLCLRPRHLHHLKPNTPPPRQLPNPHHPDFQIFHRPLSGWILRNLFLRPPLNINRSEYEN